jgi:hypothetical protein
VKHKYKELKGLGPNYGKLFLESYNQL